MALSVKNMLGGGSIGSVENLYSPKLGTVVTNGITFRNNGDGTYTLSGTAEANIWITLNGFFFENNGEYKIVGCPKGGSEITYRLYVDQLWSTDFGNGALCRGNGTTQNLVVYIENGWSGDNVVFKPMITKNLKATYNDFVKRVGGFNNLVTNLVATNTQNGVTCTNNGDGTVTLNGTASTSFGMIIGTVKLTSGLKKYCGSPNFGGNSFMYMFDFTTATQTPYDYGDGAIFTATDDTYNISVWCPQGFTFSNAIFKPMVTESLLPEYYDFVKGSSGVNLASLYGCTKIEEQTLTITSRTLLGQYSSGMSIAHSLGEKPKVVLIFRIPDSTPIQTLDVLNLMYFGDGAFGGLDNHDTNSYYGTFDSDGFYWFGNQTDIGAGFYYVSDANFMICRTGLYSSSYRYLPVGKYKIYVMA